MAKLIDQYFTEDQFRVRNEDGSITWGSIQVNADGSLKFIPREVNKAGDPRNTTPVILRKPPVILRKPPDISESLE